jgi:hypothetical protein
MQRNWPHAHLHAAHIYPALLAAPPAIIEDIGFSCGPTRSTAGRQMEPNPAARPPHPSHANLHPNAPVGWGWEGETTACSETRGQLSAGKPPKHGLELPRQAPGASPSLALALKRWCRGAYRHARRARHGGWR